MLGRLKRLFSWPEIIDADLKLDEILPCDDLANDDLMPRPPFISFGGAVIIDANPVERPPGLPAISTQLESKVKTGYPSVDSFVVDYTPAGDKTRAVILLHGYGMSRDSDEMRRMAWVFYNKGISVLRFDLPFHGERTVSGIPFDHLDGKNRIFCLPIKKLEEAKTAFEQGISNTLEVQAYAYGQGIAVLGLGGFSLGGVVAATAMGLHNHFTGLYTAFSGADISGLISHSATAAHFRALAGFPSWEKVASCFSGYDLERLAANIRAEKVFMVNDRSDPIIPAYLVRRFQENLSESGGPGIGERQLWLDVGRHYDLDGIALQAERFSEYLNAN